MEEEQKFKAGDCVQLKYGGPQMTVKTYLFGDVLCQWLKGDKLVEGGFSEASLELCPKLDK